MYCWLTVFRRRHHSDNYHLADGWRAGNLNWPIRIQRAGKILLSWRKVNKSEKALKSDNFSHWRWHERSKKWDLEFQKPYQSAEREKYEPYCVSKLLFWRQKWVTGARHGNSLVVRRVSPGGVIVMLFWTKHAVPCQIKPGILKSTSSRGQSNLRTVFIFVSCEEKGCYRIVSLGHLSFDCCSYCGFSRRMQGKTQGCNLNSSKIWLKRKFTEKLKVNNTESKQELQHHLTVWSMTQTTRVRGFALRKTKSWFIMHKGCCNLFALFQSSSISCG